MNILTSVQRERGLVQAGSHERSAIGLVDTGHPPVDQRLVSHDSALMLFQRFDRMFMTSSKSTRFLPKSIQTDRGSDLWSLPHADVGEDSKVSAVLQVDRSAGPYL